ncbi:MAG: hypothetical protein M3271_08675, partial [Actinomycetota bacterium]|nr:hypothetical protein [Actinomycetota bacterium]
SGGSSNGDAAASAAPGEDEAGDEGSDPAEDSGATAEAEGDTGGGGNEEARFNLVASPDNAECTYIPNGHLSGADQLSVHFFFLIIGGNPPDVGALSVTGSSDTGLATSYVSGPHNQAVSTAQFALREGDFGRGHLLTITVDAADQVTETDESDNRINVRVSLPSPRPTSTIDPLPCAITQAP